MHLSQEALQFGVSAGVHGGVGINFRWWVWLVGLLGSAGRSFYWFFGCALQSVLNLQIWDLCGAYFLFFNW